MSSLDILKSKYKPYRYTIIGSATKVDSSSGSFIIKRQNKDLFTLFNYLDIRGFTNHPNIVFNYQNKENVFDYNREDAIFKEQKLEELSNVIASLHNKTVYFKKTTVDDYKEIKELIEENINYMQDYYESLFKSFVLLEYPSPDKYLFLRTYFKIKLNLKFSRDHLDNWFKLSSNNSKERVCVIHNNLKMDHFIYNKDKPILISFDNYKIDTPILDIVHLYQNEYNNYDFSSFLDNYMNIFTLKDEEKELLFVLLSIPFIIRFDKSIYENTKTVRNLINYINKTDDLIRPYYLKKKE